MNTDNKKLSSVYDGFYRHGELVAVKPALDDDFKGILELLCLRPNNESFLKSAIHEFYLRYRVDSYNFNLFLSDAFNYAQEHVNKFYPPESAAKYLDRVNNIKKSNSPLPVNALFNALPNPEEGELDLNRINTPADKTTIINSYKHYINEKIMFDDTRTDRNNGNKYYTLVHGTNGDHICLGQGMRFNNVLNLNANGDLIPANAERLLSNQISRFSNFIGGIFAPFGATLIYNPKQAEGIKNHNDITLPAGVYIMLTMVEYDINGRTINIID